MFYTLCVRRNIWLMFIVCLLALSAPGYAEMQEFEMLSLDVPAGWTAEQQGATIILKAISSDASLSLASGRMGEASLEEIALKLYEQLGGVDFEEDEEGDFYFEYRDTAGVEFCVWVYTGGEDEYLVMASSGNNPSEDEMIDRIVDSIRYHVQDDEGDENEFDEENEDE